MNDTIYRQAAIDTLADMHCKSDEDGYVWIIRSDAWARIDALPSAQPDVSDTNVGDMVTRQAVKDWLLKWEGYIDIDTITRMQCRVIDIRPHRKKDVEQLPSAEPEIICCKDCKYFETAGNLLDGLCRRHRIPMTMYSTGFCSRAERRTDE